MKVKNVIKGCQNQYEIEELHIIDFDACKVIFSGSPDMQGWNYCDIDMINYKRQIENLEVIKKIVFNHKELFIFVREEPEQ